MGTYKKVKGLKCLGNDNFVLKPQNIEIRFTSDGIGETLSLSDGNVILLVPYRDVEQVVLKERKRKGKGRS